MSTADREQQESIRDFGERVQEETVAHLRLYINSTIPLDLREELLGAIKSEVYTAVRALTARAQQDMRDLVKREGEAHAAISSSVEVAVTLAGLNQALRERGVIAEKLRALVDEVAAAQIARVDAEAKALWNEGIAARVGMIHLGALTATLQTISEAIPHIFALGESWGDRAEENNIRRREIETLGTTANRIMVALKKRRRTAREIVDLLDEESDRYGTMGMHFAQDAIEKLVRLGLLAEIKDNGPSMYMHTLEGREYAGKVGRGLAEEEPVVPRAVPVTEQAIVVQVAKSDIAAAAIVLERHEHTRALVARVGALVAEAKKIDQRDANNALSRALVTLLNEAEAQAAKEWGDVCKRIVYGLLVRPERSMAGTQDTP